MIRTLDHLQLAMPSGEEDRAVEFYAGILGFQQESKPAPLAARGGCWFAAGSAKLHLGVDPEFRPQRKAHPAFLVDDREELATALQTHGQEVRWDDSLQERSRFYSDDPFGNRLEFMRYGDGFSQR